MVWSFWFSFVIDYSQLFLCLYNILWYLWLKGFNILSRRWYGFSLHTRCWLPHILNNQMKTHQNILYCLPSKNTHFFLAISLFLCYFLPTDVTQCVFPDHLLCTIVLHQRDIFVSVHVTQSELWPRLQVKITVFTGELLVNRMPLHGPLNLDMLFDIHTKWEITF